MNQTKNLTQWKNLTDEQKAEHDFEGYAYDWQDHLNWYKVIHINEKSNSGLVYRLVIEPEKWYYTMYKPDSGGFMEEVLKGSDLIDEHELNWHHLHQYEHIRPAKPSEIPKPKPEIITLEDRVKAEYGDFDVVILEWTDNAAPDANFLQVKTGDEEFEPHVIAQSMRGFYEYVYIVQSEIDDGEIDFYTSREPTEPYDILEDVKTIHPIGALFTRAGE